MKLGFIGAGRMAEAIIKGLISKKALNKKDIFASDKDTARITYLSDKFGIKTFADNVDAVKASDVILLAVKPQVMAQVLSDISKYIKNDVLVISIAAGITLKSLKKYLTKNPIVRVMPNNPCLIGEGISAIVGGDLANASHIETVEKIFSSVGDVIKVEERLMNAVTGLSGSGPAFVYEVIDAMADGGIYAGLPKELAMQLAQKTVLGSIKTLIKTKKTPEELKTMVASPGGTTLAGLRVMEEANFKSILKRAVVKASARAKEISEEFDKSL
jgi:pyrroline-5-carboxylate reductase